jgi:hypothetical protein
MADTAGILPRYRREADTANILAQYRHEADTSSAEAARNSSAAHREHIETGAAVTDPSLSADLVTRTTGVGIHIGVGPILTRTRTTAIILTGTILRMRTIMTIAPYQEGDSLAPDPQLPYLTISHPASPRGGFFFPKDF